MLRLLRIAVLVITVAGVATVASAQQKMPWGTFVHQLQLGPGMALPAMVTLNLDGSLMVAPGVMFGGLPGAPTKISPIQGVWKGTGHRTVGAASLGLIFDSNGVLIGYQRDRCSLNFSEDWKSYTGAEFVETTSCTSPFTCPDPLDPATEWTALPGMPPTGFAVTGKRVHYLAGPLKP